MKKFFTLIIFVFITASSYAQFGLTGGIDLIAGSGNAKDNLGFHVGGLYDLRLSKKMYFQPGLQFVYNRYKYDNEILSLINDKGMGNRYAFEIPAVFSFRPQLTKNSKFILDFGLYLQYAFYESANYTFATALTESGTPIECEGHASGSGNVDLGPALGIGVQIHRVSIILRGQTDFLHGIDDALCRLGVVYVFKSKKHKL